MSSPICDSPTSSEGSLRETVGSSRLPFFTLGPCPSSRSSPLSVLEKRSPSKPPKSKPVLPTDDAVLIDLLTEEPPPYQPAPPLPAQAAPGKEEEERPDSTTPTLGKEGSNSPVAGRLRGKREPTLSGGTSRAFPLRQTVGPGNQYQYWPFSASDLYNWKSHNPSFSKDPVVLTNLIESILVTH